MPNHVKNKLTVTGPETLVSEFIESVKGGWPESDKTNHFDFKKIIAPPDEYITGGCSHRHWDGHGPENCWYVWNRKNWGTKWNSYSFDGGWSEGESKAQGDPGMVRSYRADPEASRVALINSERRVGAIVSRTVVFETAWSTPMPVWERIAKDNPLLDFRILYADEDYGRNLGALVGKEGALRRSNLVSSRSILMETWGFDPDKKCEQCGGVFYYCEDECYGVEEEDGE